MARKEVKRQQTLGRRAPKLVWKTVGVLPKDLWPKAEKKSR